MSDIHAEVDELAQECVTVLRVVVVSLVTSVLLAKACVLVNMSTTMNRDL